MRVVLQSLLLAGASCALLGAGLSPAAARSCPSGQFLQVSKGKCISKESARHLGIAGHAAAKPKAEKAREASSEKAGESTVAKSAPDAAADGAAGDKADGRRETTLASASSLGPGQSLGYAAAPPQPATVTRNIAPFGALQFGGFK